MMRDRSASDCFQPRTVEMEKLFGLEIATIAGSLSAPLVLVIVAWPDGAAPAGILSNSACARSRAAGRNRL